MDEELLQLLYKNKGYSNWWTYEEFKNELYNDAKYRKKVYDETGTSKVATFDQFNKRLGVTPANAKKASADLAEARRAKSISQAAEQDGGGLWNTTRDFLNTVTDHAAEGFGGMIRPVEHAATSLYGYLTGTDVSETHKAIDKRVDRAVDVNKFIFGDPMSAVSAMFIDDDAVGEEKLSAYKKKREAANKNWDVEIFDDDKGFWDNVKGIPGKLASQPGKTLMNIGTSLADIYVDPKSVGKRFFGMAVDDAYKELKKIGEENPDLKIDEHPDLALGYAVGIGAVQGLAEKYSLELITGPAMSKRLSKYVLNKAIREVTRNGGVITTDLLDREMARVAGKLSTKVGKAGLNALIGTVVEGSEEGITEVASDGLRLAFNAVGKASGIDNNIFDTEEMMRTAGQRYVTNSVMGGLSGAPLGGFHGFFENTHDYIQHRYATDDNKENARNNINEEIANNKNYSPEIKEALQGYNDIMYDSSTKIPKDADTETKKKLMTLIAQKQHRLSEIQAADQDMGKLDPALADIEQQKQEIRKAALAHNNAEIAATYKREPIKYEDDGNGGYTRTIGDKKDHISETEYIIGRNMSEPGWSEDTDIFNEEDDDGDIADGNSTADETDTDTDNFIGDLSAGISALSGRDIQTAGPVKVGSTIEHDGVKGVVSEVNMHKDGGIRSIAYEDENGDKQFVFLNGKSLEDSGVTVKSKNKEFKNEWNETRSNASDGSIGTTNQQSPENNARTMADGDEDGGGDLQGLQNGQDQTGTNNAQSEGGIQGRTNDGTAQGVQSGDGNTSTDFKILEALERLDNKRDAKVLAAQEMASIDPGYDLDGQLKKINQEHAEETKYAPNEVMKAELAQRVHAEKEKLRKERDRKVKRVGDLARQLGENVPVDSIDRINKEYEKAKSKLEQEHNDKVAEIDRERNESKKFGKDKIPSDNIASDTIIEHKKNKYRVVTTQRSGRTIIFAEDGKEIPERIVRRTRKGPKVAKNPLFSSIERAAFGLVTDTMIEAHRKQLLKEAMDSEMGPNNAYEYALYYFARGGKVSAASIKKEIGERKLIWAIGAKWDDGAPDIEVLADRLSDEMMNAQNLEFTPDDGTQFRDAIIDVLSSYSGVRAIQDTIIQLHQSYIGTEEAETDEFIQSEYDTLSDYEKDVIEWERGMDSMNDSEMANHYMGRLELMPEAEQKAYWEAEAKAYNEQIELNKITDGEQGEYGEQRADSVGENDTGAETHSDGKLQEGEVPILGETEGKRRNTGQSEKDARGERAEGKGESTGERGRDGIEDIRPIGRGVFGNIYDQFKGKAKEAVAFLMRKKEGEAIGALHHDEIGDIDLVWGDEKAGLQKISQKHPEILNNLQERLSQAKIVSKTDNKIKLESETDFFVVSPHYFGEEKRWLITAYEKRENTASANRMNNETESVKTDNRIDTATPKDSVSNTKQQSNTESSDVEAKKADIERRQGKNGIEEIKFSNPNIRLEGFEMDGNYWNVVTSIDRPKVLVNVNGVIVPFYLTTGQGGKGLVPGWYPFFGIGKDGWLNKTDKSDMETYYERYWGKETAEIVKSISEELNNFYGTDPSAFKNDGDPNASTRPLTTLADKVEDYINSKLSYTPTANDNDARKKLRSNVEQLGREINAKYDAELAELEKKKSESEGEYTESKEKDNAGHNFIEKNGNQFLGEIGEDVSREIKRQSAPIKLSIGNEEYGASHIKKRHGDEIKDSGYESVEDFVSDVAQNYNEIRKGEQGALFIIKRNGLDKVGVIKLTQSESGEYYNVETAFVSRKEYINKKELLYSGKSSPTKDVATKSEFQKNQQQSNTDQPSSTDSNSFGNKQQSETESSDVEAKKTERQKKIDAINDEIDDIWNDFNNLGIALTPEQQVQNMGKAIRLVSLYTQKGVYKLADIIEDAINKIGRANVEDLLPFLKKALAEVGNKYYIEHKSDPGEIRLRDSRYKDIGVQFNMLSKSDFNTDGTVKEEVRREIREEKARIVSEAKANGTWMKAPNGKPSNLNEAQWVSVRTRRFKENFFGDWESANIITLAENAWNDKDFKDKVSFGISDKLSNRLNDLLGYRINQVVLTADAIRHIKNHHGQNETQRGQVDLTPNDIAILPYVLKNFDTAKLSPEFDDKKGNRAIEITKRINGISVVATIEKGRDKQFVVTSWQTKKSDALVANKTTGLYVQNDSDIAKIQNEIEKIKSAKENTSKVVDENGEPLVVYHGTASSFTVFDKAKVGSNFKSQNLGKLGFYFANHPKADTAKNWYFGTNASEFANNAASEFTDDGTGIGANVMPVFLNIKNPITINADGYYSALSAIDKNESGIIIGNALNGKDGIISRYETEESTDIAYVATDPTQIKSAIGNVGTFSSDSNDIRYSASGEIDPAYHAAVQAEELGNNNPNIPIIIDLSETNNDRGEILKKFAGTWLDLIQDKHSPFYQRGLDLIKDTEYYEKAGKDARKALEMAIADNTNTIKKSSGLITWLRNFWIRVGKTLNLNISGEELSNLTLQQYLDLASGQLLFSNDLMIQAHENIAELENNAPLNRGEQAPVDESIRDKYKRMANAAKNGGTKSTNTATQASPANMSGTKSHAFDNRNTSMQGRELRDAGSTQSDILLRVYDGTRKELIETLYLLMPTLKNAGIKVFFHDKNDSYWNAVVANEGSKSGALNSDAFYNNGVIHINLTNANIQPHVALHEAMHPIIRDLLLSNPEAFRGFVDEILNDPELRALYKDAFVDQYYSAFDTEVQDEEMLTEATARIVFEKILRNLNNAPKSSVERLINYIKNYLGERFGQLFGYVNTNAKFIDFANSMADAIANGQIVELSDKSKAIIKEAQKGDNRFHATDNVENEQKDGEDRNTTTPKRSINYKSILDNNEKVSEIARSIFEGGSSIARLNRKEEQGRIRGGIRNVEASVLLGADQRANSSEYEQKEGESVRQYHTRIYDRQSNLLKSWAKENGLLKSKDEIRNNSVAKMPRGSEAEVFVNKDGKYVTKIVDVSKYSDTPSEFIDNRISLYNYLFKGTAYQLDGIVEVGDKIHFVLTQPMIQGMEMEAKSQLGDKTQKGKLEKYLADKMKLYPTGYDEYGNNNYILSDVHLNNVFQGKNNMLYFIDVIPSLNTRHREYAPFEIKDNSDIRFHMSREIQQERTDIETKAKGDGTWMKAPNGKPSNLNEAQWVSVRTRKFKENFFGDWEKAIRIEKLLNSKAVEASGNEYRGKYDLNASSAQEYIKEKLRGSYDILDTGDRVDITSVGAKEVTAHNRYDEVHLKSISIIPEMLKNAIFIDEQESTKGNSRYDQYRYYAVGLKIGNTDYTAKIVVGVKNGKKFYDHRLTAIEKGKLIDSPSLYHGDFTPKGSESDLLMSQGKDKKLYSILQNSASKVVDENGEPMVVYHGTDNIFTEFKRSENAGTHGESDQLEGIYFADNKEAADWFTDTGNIVPTFLNIRNPYRAERVKTLKEEQNSDTLKGISGKIEKQGFDGIVLDVGFVAKGEQKLILAFNPNQIKSATDNNGEFSKGNNNIRFHFSDAVENIKANMRLDIINNPKEDWEAIAQDMVDEGVFEKQDVDDILAAWRNAKRTKSNPTQTNAALEHMENLQQERKMTEKDNRKVNNAALTELIEMLNNGGNLEEMINLYNPYKMKQAVQSVVERGMGHPQDVLATLMELNAQRRPLNVEETIAVGVAISQLEETLSLFPKGSRQYDDTAAMLSQIAIEDKLNGSFAGGALGVRAKLMQMAGLTYHGVMREIESLNKKHKNVEIEEAHKKEIEALVKQHNAIEKALNDANKKLEERLKDAAKKEVAGRSNSGKSTGRSQGSGRSLEDIKESILARSKGGALFHLRYSATTNVSTETDDINDMVDWAILNGVAGFENIVNKVIDEWPVPGMTKEKVYRAVLTVTATAKAKAIDEFSQRKSELKDHIRKLNKLESIVHGQADALVKGHNDTIEKQAQMVGRLLNEIEAGIYRMNADPTLTDTWLDMIRAIRGDYEMSFLNGGTETEVLNKIMNAVSMMKDAKTARWLKEAMAAADKAIVDINNGKTHELVNISPDTFEAMPAKNVTFDVYDSNGNVTGQRTMTMGQAARMIAEKRKEINNVKDKYRKPPPKWMQWYNIIRGTVGSSKAMIDMSATLIQGYGAFAVNMFRNPKALTKALGKSLVAAADEFRKNPGVADEIYRQITENPYYDIAIKYGLNITAPDGMYVNEEMIGTDLFEVAEDALKGKTNMAAKGAKVALNARNRLKNASNAAFATHLNLLSMSMFHQYMEDAAKKNFVPSKEEMEIVIKAINNATGRPTIKETWASKLIWAPRLYLSQIFNLFNMVLDPGRWAKAKIMGQKELSRAYAYRAGNGLALATLLAMSYGLKMLYAKLKCGKTGLQMDWQKSNFLKVKCTDEEKGTEISMDASGNMRQWIYQGIVAAHYATGDQIVRMNKEVPYTNIMADWANTHLNPGLGFLKELGTGRDFMNKRTVEDNEGLNRAAIAGKALLPIWPGNIYEYATARGLTPAERIGFTAASAFGPNINYKDLDEEEKEKAEETARNKAKRDEEKAENIKNAQQEWIGQYGGVPDDFKGQFSVSGSPGETTVFDYSTVKPTGRTILLGRKNKKVRYNVYLRNTDTNHNGLLDDLITIRTTKRKTSLNYGKKYATSYGVNWAQVMGNIKPEKAPR